MGIGVQSPTEDRMRPNSSSTYNRDNPDLACPAAVVVGADGRTVPVVGQVPASGAAGSESGYDQAALDATELEADYIGPRQWLSELEAPATKIESKKRMAGKGIHTVTTASLVINLMTLPEPGPYSSRGAGEQGIRSWGHERAVALAYAAYAAAPVALAR